MYRKLLVILLMALIITGCSGPDNSNVTGESWSGDSYIYTVEVEGMPCVVASKIRAVSITCNWEMWEPSGR